MNARYLPLAACLALVPVAAAQTLVNPSFEFGAPVNTAGAAPSGGWGWDQSAYVPTTMGITPASGSRMLRFIATDPSGPSADGVCRVAQVVDFTPLASQINAGAVTVTFGAVFNRNPGTIPSMSDSLFRVIIAAYNTPVISQSTNFPSGAMALINSALLADSNLNTWQSSSISLPLPVGTTHVLFALDAAENNWNDISTNEFSGHFADAAKMSYTPAPGTFGLLAAPLLLAARRRR